MKKIVFHFVYLSTLLFLLHLKAEKVKVRILQTTDIHSYIEHGDKPGSGGWLRLSTLIKKHRAREECLLIDCGDTIQGSLSALASRGEAAIDMLNHLKYDVWVPGNHELDFGISRLSQLLDKTQVPILNGNFKILGKNPRSFESWKIFNVKGVRICVIGMQASYLNHWFKGLDFEEYKIEKAFDVIKRQMPDILKEKPDAIVLALHQGFRFTDSRGVNEVSQIAKRFPEIDIILGGHTHQAHPGRNLSGVYYSQAAYHASHLGIIDLHFDTDTKGVVRIESGLEKVDSSVNKDPVAEEVFDRWRQSVRDFKEKVIVDLESPVSSRGLAGKSSGTAAVIAESLRFISKADFAIHGKFTSSGIPQKVTDASLFKVIPYENYIFKLTVNRQQILKIMEEQVKYIKSGSFNGPCGFQVNLNKESGIKSISLPADQKVYSLAVNSRVAAGGGGRFPWLKEQIEAGTIRAEEIKINTRDALKEYLINGPKPFSASNNILYD